MAKARVAHQDVTGTDREATVHEYFKQPDHSSVGFHLSDLAALLTLLDDLHSEAIQIDYSPIGQRMGLDREHLRIRLMRCTIDQAGQCLVEVREALHDLFREVQLTPRPPKAVV
jgi:hypothetical protein